MYDQGCSVSALYQWRRCIIYFVHLTNPVDTLRPSTTCRKFENHPFGKKDRMFRTKTVMIMINHHHLYSLLSSGFLMEEVTDRYQDVDVALVFPVLGPYSQPGYNFQTSLFRPFFSPKELLRLPVDSAKERELSRPRVNCESLAISFHNGVPNLMTHWLIQSAS